VNSAAINMGVQVSPLYTDLDPMYPESGIVALYGSSTFSFSRNCHTDFHSGCANFNQLCKETVLSRALVAQACSPRYSGSRAQEDQG
jgi:hypothetical protein